MKVSYIFTRIVSIRDISIRFVIGDLLAREIILRNSMNEIPRPCDSAILYASIRTVRAHRDTREPSGKCVKRYRAARNTRKRTKVQQSKFRDGRHRARISFTPSFCPANGALNEVKLTPIDPELPRRMDLALKILFYRKRRRSNMDDILSRGSRQTKRKKTCAVWRGYCKSMCSTLRILKCAEIYGDVKREKWQEFSSSVT